MIKDVCKDFIVSFGIDILKEHGNEKYSEKEIKKELYKYIESEFSRFETFDRNKEIDFENIYHYISKEFIEDFRECMYGDRKQREQKLNTVISRLSEKTCANTKTKREYVELIIKNAYNIVSNFYERVFINIRDRLLVNKIADEVSDVIRSDLNKVEENIKNEVGQKIEELDKSIKELNGDVKKTEGILSITSVRRETFNYMKSTDFYDIYNAVLEKFIKKSYKGKSSINFKNYSDLFKLCVNVVNDRAEEVEINNLFEFVKDKLNENEESDKEENFIKIKGPDGTGKSTFLSILYMYLYESFANGVITNYPFYINLHYYDTIIMDGEGKEHIIDLIKEDIKPLIELSKKFSDGILIIIDGNESYVRTTLKAGIILRDLLNEIKGHKKIICIGEKTSVHTYKERKDTIYLSEVTKYTIDFNSICMDDSENVKKFINQFAITLESRFVTNEVLRFIEKFKLREIDYNFLSIFNQCYKKGDLNKVSSINDLYRKYCMLYFDGEERCFEISGELAYEYFMTRKSIDQKLIAKHWKEWELIHQHKTISNYFLAMHYGKLIMSFQKSDISKLQCVLNNEINIFLKAIVNETSESQKIVCKKCQEIYKAGNYLAKAQSVYILGRFDNGELRKEVINFLEPIYTELIKEIKEKRYIEKEKLFLFRSISISLFMQGRNDDKGKLLLELLLTNRRLNEINRAFFLQYYGDIEVEPEHVILEDDGNASIEYSFNLLYNKVNSYINKKRSNQTDKERYDFQINLFTLCSLVQVRLNKGINETYINKLKNIINRTFNNDRITLSINMKTYLLMLKDDIDDKAYDVGHIYDDLYLVKDVIRSGWIDKIEEGSVTVERYENIVEHMYYTWLLGMLYLPDTISTDEKEYKYYNKNKILNCILVHDLAKAHVGDKRPEEKTDEHKSNENEWMHKIFMHDTYSDIYSMESYRKIWKQFKPNPTDINCKIAKELEIIQSIYQFYIYLNNGAKFKDGKEQEWKKEKRKIKTWVGQKILEEVILKKFEVE